jgi:hypothetical protein
MNAVIGSPILAVSADENSTVSDGVFQRSSIKASFL